MFCVGFFLLLNFWIYFNISASPYALCLYIHGHNVIIVLFWTPQIHSHIFQTCSYFRINLNHIKRKHQHPLFMTIIVKNFHLFLLKSEGFWSWTIYTVRAWVKMILAKILLQISLIFYRKFVFFFFLSWIRPSPKICAFNSKDYLGLVVKPEISWNRL